MRRFVGGRIWGVWSGGLWFVGLRVRVVVGVGWMGHVRLLRRTWLFAGARGGDCGLSHCGDFRDETLRQGMVWEVALAGNSHRHSQEVVLSQPHGSVCNALLVRALASFDAVCR